MCLSSTGLKYMFKMLTEKPVVTKGRRWGLETGYSVVKSANDE